MNKYLLLALAAICMQGTIEGKKQKPCGKSKSGCQDLKNPCQCYCSWECNFRDKQPDDQPIYIKNDPAGVYCYCKQRDLDYYYTHGCHLSDQDRRLSANEE